MAKITSKNNSADNLSELFSKGHYTAILQIYRKKSSALSSADLSWVIGALSFLGHPLEARELYRAQKDSFTELSHAAALFFLGLGISRKSQYKEARKIFRLNQKLHAKNKNPEIAFYSYQGIAFYLFYTGQFFRCEKFVTEAFQLSIRANNPQIKILALDLLAHTLIKTGQVHAGLKLLEESNQVSKEAGNKAFASATQISILLYEAAYGFRPKTIVKELTQSLNELDVQDSFPKTNIIFEIARQKTLRGEWSEAEALLNNRAPTIFASENRRHEIQLNLYWAKIAFLRGQLVLAWQFLRSAQLRLHEEADKNLEMQILSLEVDILEEQKSPLSEEKRNHLLQLCTSFSSMINLNMLARRNWIKATQTSGDDAIHDALAQISAHPEKALKLIADSGYYSWFYKCLPLQRGRNYIVLGAKKNSLVLFSHEGVQVHTLAESSLRLLEVLEQGSISKAELVEKVWGYEYHPLRHDNLVYSAMSTLRKGLGSNHHWVQTEESGYKLHDEVTVVRFKPSAGKALSAANPPKKVSPRLVLNTQLNHRQMQALEYLQQHRFINTREYKALFQTTEITASRDLTSLNKNGHVLKIGFGRSTHYTLPEGSQT